jgi:Family of unknown function (DUF6510)
MEALDGNAIAGPLAEYFGAEMTTIRSACGHCGAHGVIAKLRVYLSAAGAVARCPGCGNVVMVVVSVHGVPRVDHGWLRLVDQPGSRRA